MMSDKIFINIRQWTVYTYPEKINYKKIPKNITFYDVYKQIFEINPTLTKSINIYEFLRTDDRDIVLMIIGFIAKCISVNSQSNSYRQNIKQML